jgi:nicotinamide riboside transporter PnuC
MYETALIVHNAFRWLAFAAVAFAFMRAVSGMMGVRPFDALDRRASLIATIVMDVQFTLGLLLYFVWSPQVKTAMQDFGAAMKNPELRYWAVEHAATMVLALTFVHVGKVLSKKATAHASKHRRAGLWFGLALLFMLIRTPWPGTSVPRPWLRS